MKLKIEFLGLIIDETGIEMQPHISEKIHLFPHKLESKEKIQRFLGCLNYAKGYIENLAKKRQSLQGLLRKNNTKSWEDLHTKVVKRLKEKFKNLPRLGFPTSSDNLILEIDASDNHCGAVLKTY